MSSSGAESTRSGASTSRRSRRLQAVDELRSAPRGTVSRFLGREREVGELAQMLDDERVVTLTGPPGIGKTRLALEVAGNVTRLTRFRDGARLVELGAVGDPAMVPGAVASALSLSEVAGQPLTDIVLGYLRSHKVLLVLDNCEHLLDACAELADRCWTGVMSSRSWRRVASPWGGRAGMAGAAIAGA